MWLVNDSKSTGATYIDLDRVSEIGIDAMPHKENGYYVRIEGMTACTDVARNKTREEAELIARQLMKAIDLAKHTAIEYNSPAIVTLDDIINERY